MLAKPLRLDTKARILASVLLIWGIGLAPLQARDEIGAVGEFQPGSGILELIGTPGARISEILVKAGEEVDKGDVLVTFSNYDVLKAQVDLASFELDHLRRTRETKLALQAHAVESARLALERSRRKLRDQERLGPVATSKRELTDLEDLVVDARRSLERETTQQQQLLIRLELEELKAKARLDLAHARFRDAVMKAPISGTVLAVLKEVGESLGVGEIGTATLDIAAVSIADLTRMYVVCDVYEGDLLRIHEGMKAKASSAAISGDITGVIERISRQVDTSSRLGRVWILLDEAELASRLIGMEVQVKILL